MSSSIKILIIEDEKVSQHRLIDFLNTYNSSICISAALESVNETTKFLNEGNTPDLILADIELIDGNVFQVFEGGDFSIPVIFITSYSDYWIKAFESNGVGYLLKPFSFESFKLTLDRFFKLSNQWASRERKATKFKEVVLVKSKKYLLPVPINSISYFVVENQLLYAVNPEGVKSITHYSTLSEIKNAVDPNLFFQINRNEIINFNFLERILSHDHNRLEIYIKGTPRPFIISAPRVGLFRSWIDR